MSFATALDKMLAAKEAATPEEGYNLVVVDTFDELGADLTVVSHHATREEAEQAKVEAEAENDVDEFYVYGPEGEEDE